MNMVCEYLNGRESALVEYVYGDMEPAAHAEFSDHLSGCGVCRAELTELIGIRSALGKWAPPEPGRVVLDSERHFAAASPLTSTRSWHVPAWAQAAAAVLIMGAAAGVANLDIHYGGDGLSIHTGWSRPAAPRAADPAPPADAALWRSDVSALERRLRAEFHPAVLPTAASASRDDDALLRRVRALIDESERRQRRELALRVAEALTDVNAQRQADLQRIGNNIGVLMNNTGIEAIRQRQVQNELLGYIQRVSQQK